MSVKKIASDKEYGKSLERLFKSTSTSRVLNLLRVFRQNARSGEATGFKPIFQTTALNKSFVIKHKLRNHERGLFQEERLLATKILIPFDTEDLTLGGQSFFVGEASFEDLLQQAAYGRKVEPADIRLLRAFDEIPSFDPFVLREWTRRHGFFIASEYFQLDPAVAFRMESLVVAEVQKLVFKSIGSATTHETTRKLVSRLLNDDQTGDVSALRAVLTLGKDEFHEAMFGWRGFLYYKWEALQLENAIEKVVDQLRKVEVRDADADQKRYISQARGRIAISLVESYNEAVAVIDNYDRAYKALIDGDNPAPFRAFLREAHKRFYRLGEVIAQINHVVQFWRFRSSGGTVLSYDAEELADLLRDFEIGLGVEASGPPTRY